jgi:hypothetical protein
MNDIINKLNYHEILKELNDYFDLINEDLWIMEMHMFQLQMGIRENS